MGVYNLQNPQDLENDFNNIWNRLNQIYSIDTSNGQIQITPKLADSSDTFWASEENSIEFNKHVPTFKSLHTDMYSFIEAISIQKFQEYKYEYFESKYPDYREFRLLNNMIKHPKKKEVEINLTKIVHMIPKQFDLMCNFKYPHSSKYLTYSSFIILFLTILKDLQVIAETN